ncbi:MAG: class I SAM-dependent methyltransferase [Deltaproteobacteria bacterium]|nr:class I SAM-dependent methyltransferase [Deltaproteobacteria bacterium]
MVAPSYEQDVADGQRFEFGKNWSRFLAVLDDERVEEATRALREMLGVDSLAGKTFVDVGSGSGLHSLAAMRLGATRVRSFDFDPHSVACTQELKRRYFADSTTWTVEQGSALDPAFLGSLGTFDVVYSWGVLHHTGDMWRALDLVAPLAAPGGILFIAIYRDQGWRSRAWLGIKRFYNSGTMGRVLAGGAYSAYYAVGGALDDAIRLRDPRQRYAEYKKSRGMSKVTDWIDWVGGLPFEVATPDEIFDFFKQRGFALERLTTVVGHGCNQYIFSKR